MKLSPRHASNERTKLCDGPSGTKGENCTRGEAAVRGRAGHVSDPTTSRYFRHFDFETGFGTAFPRFWGQSRRSRLQVSKTTVLGSAIDLHWLTVAEEPPIQRETLRQNTVEHSQRRREAQQRPRRSTALFRLFLPALQLQIRDFVKMT
jgi:hypothetical protein